MREIKFRAWDKAAKAMSPEFVLFGEFTLLGAVHDWQWEVLKKENDLAVMVQQYDSLGRLNDLEIMQFTGLKDKNGKEIYEGDICRLITDSFSNKLGRSNKEWKVMIMYQEFDCSFVATAEKTESALTWHFGETDFNGFPFMYEVIGNIYENPELLNQEPH